MNNPYQYQYNLNPYQMQPPKTIGNTINWVQGIEGAKAFQLMPNANAVMLDSENDGIFYIKTSDNVGMCNMRTFKFEEITNAPQTPQVDLSDYVRKDELQELLSKAFNSEVKHEQTVSADANPASGKKLNFSF